MRGCAVALLFAVSCSRCGGTKSAGSAEELLAAQSPGAVVTAPLAIAAQHAAELATRLAQLPGGEQAQDTRKALAAQLGFDPFTREGLLQAGLDPDRAAAATLSPGQGFVAALPLTKPDVFLQTIDRIARERAGYATRTDEVREGARVAVYEGRGKLAVAVVRGYGIVARGADPAADVAQVATRAPEQSLARDERLSTQRKRLGAQDVVLFAPQGSPLGARLAGRPLPADAALGVSGSPQGLALRTATTLAAGETLPGGGASLVELLPAGAPIRLRLGVAPRKLFDELRAFPQLGPLLARVPPALVDALEPGAAISLALRPQANLGAAIDYGFDVRQKSPFDTVELCALASVRDAAAARRGLAELAAALPAFGARAARHGDDYVVRYVAGDGGRFGLREIEGKTVAYFLGGGPSPEGLHRSPRPASLDSAALYIDAGAAAFADFGRLAATVHALPDAAYGSGPQSYVARSLVSQVIEPLRALRIEAAATPSPDGLTAQLVFGLVP